MQIVKKIKVADGYASIGQTVYMVSSICNRRQAIEVVIKAPPAQHVGIMVKLVEAKDGPRDGRLFVYPERLYIDKDSPECRREMIKRLGEWIKIAEQRVASLRQQADIFHQAADQKEIEIQEMAAKQNALRARDDGCPTENI